MIMKELFEFNNYQLYLKYQLERQGKGRRGLKSQFAEAVKCNPAYVTRLLEGTALLSLEQGLRANIFLGHTAEEGEFFLALIGLARAGSTELKDYFKKRLESLREQRSQLSKRIKATESLPEVIQGKYYSLWLYAAVDIATSIPSLQTVQALSEYFEIPLAEVTSILSFLEEAGMVHYEEGLWKNTNRSIYLSPDSPHLRKHHLNWRLKAMQLIERVQTKNLHYSSVVSISHKEFENLKQHFIQSVIKAREIVKDSPNEVVAGYNIDCFLLK